MKFRRPMKTRFPFSLVLATVGAASLMAVEITLPEETARLAESPLPGYGMAVTYCYTCHSTDYVQYQPSMTRAAWKGSVVKMQKTFGAVIPDDAVEPIAEYLAKTYGAERGSTNRAAASPAANATPPSNANAGRK
jgi:hypothetical protein